MRRILVTSLVVLIAACSDLDRSVTAPEGTADPSTSAFTAPSGEIYKPGQLLARFAPGTAASDVAATYGASVDREISLGIRVLNVPRGQEMALAEALGANPNVIYAEPVWARRPAVICELGDCVAPSDVFFSYQWDRHNDGTVESVSGNVLAQTGAVDADVDWLEAYNLLGDFQGSAALGIVDTGIRDDHEEFVGRVLAQHDFFQIDPVADDEQGHGTHVSGIALAPANGKGVSGVAYGPDVGLIMAKGCGNTLIGFLCWLPDIIDGIVWAVDSGANALSISLASSEPSASEQEAFQYAETNDVLPVCAAGNERGAVTYPAAYPECMAVSATDWGDGAASYTNRGPEIEVAAPGGDTIHSGDYDRIMSTWHSNTNAYAHAAGTSMAAPQVGGLATLLHALGVTSAADKRALIRSTADDLGPAGRDDLFGDGRINVWAAVEAAIGGEPPPPPPPENQPPTSSFTYDCADLTCDFVDGSSDSDGTVVAWSWDFGDGATSTLQSPSHTYAAGGTYTVSLTVTDDGGLTGASSQDVTVTEPSSGGDILLVLDPFKERGQHVVDVVWGGATTSFVDVHRDGVVIATVSNDFPAYRDYTEGRGKATYVYKVCEEGTSVCSNEETAVF